MSLQVPKSHQLLAFIRNGLPVLTKCYHSLNKPWTKLYLPKNTSSVVQPCYQVRGMTNVCDNSLEESSNVCSSEPGQWPSGNRTTFKFHPEIETELNKHIRVEFKAFYYYLSMANYFNRVDVALPGCRKYFLKMHKEEHDHALQFMNFINMRGGSVLLCAFETPPDQDWKCPLNAFQTALNLELEISEKLESINEIAKKHNDLSTSDFITTKFMQDQVESVNGIAKIITTLTGIGDHALSRYLFDQNLLKFCSKSYLHGNKRHGQCM